MLHVADRRKKGQQGFTLIEIIAVLVILGILAVVAVPKYQDLQSEARKSAAKGLVAAAQSELSMTYAAYKLNSTSTTLDTKLTDLCNTTSLGISNGDGTVTCTGNPEGDKGWLTGYVTIVANVVGGSTDKVTGYWNSPEAKK
ncbi:pilin [Solidesulfovibrio sp. C21]|uniref:pilin n=1 Tax=Solidesulfovibrio sp. C21 TaxID=3398613 RepID=UPI0039FD5F6B